MSKYSLQYLKGANKLVNEALSLPFLPELPDDPSVIHPIHTSSKLPKVATSVDATNYLITPHGLSVPVISKATSCSNSDATSVKRTPVPLGRQGAFYYRDQTKPSA